jgi:hypothetical protein
MPFKAFFVVLLDMLDGADRLIVFESRMSMAIILILIYVIKYLLEAVMRMPSTFQHFIPEAQDPYPGIDRSPLICLVFDRIDFDAEHADRVQDLTVFVFLCVMPPDQKLDKAYNAASDQGDQYCLKIHRASYSVAMPLCVLKKETTFYGGFLGSAEYFILVSLFG